MHVGQEAGGLVRKSNNGFVSHTSDSDMPHYTFEIEAGEGFPDCLHVALADRETAEMHAMDCASTLLHQQNALDREMVVRITIRDENRELLDTLLSVAD